MNFNPTHLNSLSTALVVRLSLIFALVAGVLSGHIIVVAPLSGAAFLLAWYFRAQGALSLAPYLATHLCIWTAVCMYGFATAHEPPVGYLCCLCALYFLWGAFNVWLLRPRDDRQADLGAQFCQFGAGPFFWGLALLMLIAAGLISLIEKADDKLNA